MELSEIIATIEKTAPLSASAEWDVSGVQVASRCNTAKAVAVMLDPSLASIRAALESGADFLLTHHPLSMKPRFPNKADSYLEIIALLLRADACLYSAHTSLDANPAGPARWLAQELGLVRVRTLEPMETLPAPPEEKPSPAKDAPLEPAYGFGFTGELAAPLAYEDFCEKLRTLIGLPAWTACGARPDTVYRVACCPGSGSGLLPLAVAAGADVFITGDLKYHTALDASELLPRILDVGHFSLEEEMMRRFALQLDSELPIPVAFFPSRDPLNRE